MRRTVPMTPPRGALILVLLLAGWLHGGASAEAACCRAADHHALGDLVFLPDIEEALRHARVEGRLGVLHFRMLGDLVGDT